MSHPKLLHKLASYGICGKLLNWISSFLNGRVQRVRVGTSLSSICLVTSGVPQGSVLGPILFNLYINDITDSLNCFTSSKIFADDLKIYTEFNTNTQPIHLQTHLDLILEWSLTWQLKISQSKCNILFIGHHKIRPSFSISSSEITVSEYVTDLGVTIDPKLNFNSHIGGMVSKAKQRCALIHRCFLSRCSSNLIRAYKTYVRPLVEYAPQVWSPHTKSLLSLVEGVQRSFTKRLPGLNSSTYAQRLTNLQLQSLEHRRIICDLVMTFNIIHGFTALNFDDFFSFSTNLSSRGHPFKLNFPLFTNNNYKKHFFSSRIVPIWNALPINLVMARL